jgi:hypothetical protein
MGIRLTPFHIKLLNIRQASFTYHAAERGVIHCLCPQAHKRSQSRADEREAPVERVVLLSFRPDGSHLPRVQ